MFRGREIQRKDIGIVMLTKVEELLSDNSIDIVLNITIPQVHFEVSKKIQNHFNN